MQQLIADASKHLGGSPCDSSIKYACCKNNRVSQLFNVNMQIIVCNMKYLDRKYQASNMNLTLNMFWVDTKMMLEYAWCIGIDSITTDNCQELSKHNVNQLFLVNVKYICDVSHSM